MVLMSSTNTADIYLIAYLGDASSGQYPPQFVAPTYYGSDGQPQTLSNDGLQFLFRDPMDTGIIPAYACSSLVKPKRGYDDLADIPLQAFRE
ncbi:hypothetical protein HDV00_006019 [Rhizophlyctis rosea]|nr:hypothetical protein HDV00_006019 [Rhizophlyctis rosea]